MIEKRQRKAVINRPSECLCLINEASLVGHKDNIISNEREKRFEVHQGIVLSLIGVSIFTITLFKETKTK